MEYFYAVMWFAVGLILIFSFAKEHKIFYLAGGFFVLLGAWWLADALLPDDNLFAGAWGGALQIVTLIALVILSVFFFLERQKNVKQEMTGKKEAEKEKEEPPQTPPADDSLRANVSGVNIMRPRGGPEDGSEDEKK